MIELLDFVRTRGLPAAALRARIALDVVEQDTSQLVADAPRVTIERVAIDELGRAHAPACSSHGHLATLLWEILAGRVAESDDLPWSDPADDLPSGVLDIFASLTLRPAKDMDELCRRFAAGIRSHAASHEEVARAVAGPERITLRAPPVQIEALRTLSAGEAAPPIGDGIVTRVCPVVTLPVVTQPPLDERPRSTLDPWHAPTRDVEVTQASAALSVEPPPRRRRTWPVVAACLIAAVALIGVASRRAAVTAAAPPRASEAAAIATSSASAITPRTAASIAEPTPPDPAPSTNRSAALPPTIAKTAPRWRARTEAMPAAPTAAPTAEPTATQAVTASSAPPPEAPAPTAEPAPFE